MSRLLLFLVLMIPVDSVRMFIGDFMKQWDIKGAQIAVTKDNKFIFSEGFGSADLTTGEKMRTDNIMRIASASKLVTAIGIMKLEQEGRLSLSDTVFGANGILNDQEYINAIRDKRYYKITVENLLRHEAGFRADRFDPMFESSAICKRFNFSARPSSKTLMTALVRDPLGFYPGSAMEYSNVGYLLLSMIIEKITGAGYEEWMRKEILIPCGCSDMYLGKNYYERKRPAEVRYYCYHGQKLEKDCENPERMVEACYGGNDIEWLYGAGAWLASAEDLCRLVSAADGKDGAIACKRDILSKESVFKMTLWYDRATYSLGWNDTETGWTRTGTFSGTIALIYRFPDGECISLLCNTSTWKGGKISRKTKYLLRRIHGLNLPC